VASRREIESLQRFIFSSIEQLLGTLDGLTEAELNWRPPAANANSLYALAVHTLGNAEENIMQTVCGQPRPRDRAGEFAAHGTSPEAVHAQWRDLRGRIEAALAALPPAALDEERDHPRRGRQLPPLPDPRIMPSRTTRPPIAPAAGGKGGRVDRGPHPAPTRRPQPWPSPPPGR